MGRKLPPPILLKVEGLSQEPTNTFVDDFTGEVLPVLSSKQRQGKVISGNEADLERHRAAEIRRDTILRLSGILPTKAAAASRYVIPTIPNKRPIATLTVQGKPIAIYIPSTDPIRRGH